MTKLRVSLPTSLWSSPRPLHRPARSARSGTIDSSATAWTARCVPWRCSTTGRAPRCTSAATSAGSAGAGPATSASGTASAGRRWGAASTCPCTRSSCSTTAPARRCTRVDRSASRAGSPSNRVAKWDGADVVGAGHRDGGILGRFGGCAHGVRRRLGRRALRGRIVHDGRRRQRESDREVGRSELVGARRGHDRIPERASVRALCGVRRRNGNRAPRRRRVPHGGRRRTIQHVAKWNGSSWSGLSTGMDTSDTWTRSACSTTARVPRSTPAASSATAGGTSAAYVAKWNGSSRPSLANGVNNFVFGLRVFDEGSGPALLRGRKVHSAGATVARGITRWDGVKLVERAGGLGTSLGTRCTRSRSSTTAEQRAVRGWILHYGRHVRRARIAKLQNARGPASAVAGSSMGTIAASVFDSPCSTTARGRSSMQPAASTMQGPDACSIARWDGFARGLRSGSG